MTTTIPRWANRERAAEYLGISFATLRRYVNAGIITPHGLGPAVRYDLNEIDNALRAGTTTRLKTNAAARDQAARDALTAVRARIPTGKPLIPVTVVLDIIAAVEAEHTPAETPAP